MFYSVGKNNFVDYESAQRKARLTGHCIRVWHQGYVIRTVKVPCYDIPTALRSDYENLADFASDVQKYWMFEECLAYPCAITLRRALELMERTPANEISPLYAQFLLVCKNDVLLEQADRIWMDSQEQDDPFTQWVDTHEEDWKW